MTVLTNTQIDPGTQVAKLIVLPPLRQDDELATASFAADCITFIQNYGPTLNAANMALISAGVLGKLWMSHWAKAPKTERQIRSVLADAFDETGKSKRYEFTLLACQIAENPEAQALAAEAVRAGSTESAIQLLAAKFRELAPSVAALARHFGTARSSGRRADVRRTSFSDWLHKGVEKALRVGASIDVVESMNAVLAQASGAELFRVIKRLLPYISDDGLRELSDIIARTLMHREARDQRSPQRVELTTEMHASLPQ